MAEAAILNYDDLDNVAKLQKSQRFHDIMKVRSLSPQQYIILIPVLYSILFTPQFVVYNTQSLVVSAEGG